MNAWNAVLPPTLSAPSVRGRIVGAVRIVALVVLTLLALGIFVVGRFLRGALGRRVVFHFRAVRVWALGCLWLAGLRLRVSGTPIPGGALVANHSSWLDILALRAVRLMYFVSKAEVAGWPGVGLLARVTGTIFIERRRGEAKRQEAVLRQRIAHDQLLCFFPEGTSTDGLRVLPFKSSLFSVFFRDGQGTDIAVQPVSLRYAPHPGSGLPDAFYGWWGAMPFEGHIWDVVTRSHGGTVEVAFHAPVCAAEFADRKALANHCCAVVARGLGLDPPGTISDVTG